MFRINILLHCFFFFLQLGLWEKPPIPKAERQHFHSQPLFHFTFNVLEWNQSASPSQSFVTVPYIFPTVNSRPAITLPSILISNQFNFSGGKKKRRNLAVDCGFYKPPSNKEMICFEEAIILTFSEQVRYSILLFVITLILSNSLQGFIGFNKQPISWKDVRRTSLLSYQATKSISNYSKKNDKTHFIPSHLLPALCRVIKLLTGLQDNMYIYVCTNGPLY